MQPQPHRGLTNTARRGQPALSKRTENLGAMVQVAERIRHAGRLDEAENLWQQLLEKFPGDPQPYVGYANLLSQLQRHGEAYDLCKKVAAIAPHDYKVWRQFARCLVNLAQFEPAAVAFRKAIALQPAHVETLCEFAHALCGAGQTDNALRVFDQAIETKPGHARSHLGKGIQLQSLGRLDEARICFLRTIELEPECVSAHLNLSLIEQTPAQADFLLTQLEPIKSLAKLPSRSQATAWFASANILRRQAKHDDAFMHYTKANDFLKGEDKYDREAYTAWIDDAIEAYTPDRFDGLRDAGSTSQSPIFIVGMPNSGTSLVEAIIASHPDVKAGGAEPKLSEIAVALGQSENGQRYPQTIADIKSAHLMPYGTQYLSHMARLHPGVCKRTDALPFNFLHLGLAGILFPRATIVHCVRDPLDTCLSSYFQCPREDTDPGFTSSLEDLGYVYAQYQRLMIHWSKVLPISIVEIRYEDLLGAKEDVGRTVLSHVGLASDDTYFDTGGQKQDPLGGSAEECWRAYEHHLATLRSALGQAD